MELLGCELLGIDEGRELVGAADEGLAVLGRRDGCELLGCDELGVDVDGLSDGLLLLGWDDGLTVAVGRLLLGIEEGRTEVGTAVG